MSINVKLKEQHAKLIETVRRIKTKNEWRLSLYKGFIRHDTISISENNILDQAITNTPQNIRLVAEIELKKNNGFLLTDTADSVSDSEIKPLVISIRNYINYLFLSLDIQFKNIK